MVPPRPRPGAPSDADLVVDAPAVDDSTPDAGAEFTLSATVRNRGGGKSATLNAPADGGTYYCGACVDAVTDESDTAFVLVRVYQVSDSLTISPDSVSLAVDRDGHPEGRRSWTPTGTTYPWQKATRVDWWWHGDDNGDGQHLIGRGDSAG